ncbi:MAG: sigma-70 family RNA polymerase sigma factor [Verrucomicrobiales bacterium]
MFDSAPDPPVTEVKIRDGDPSEAEQLLPLVYQELRQLAESRMAKEGDGHTLQPTALVHEAYARLVSPTADKQWHGRRHFFAAAAEAMRRILVDHARRKQSRKRGGDWSKTLLEVDSIPDHEISDRILEVNEALSAFEKVDPAKAEIVRLRYFAGMTNDEAAATLGISLATLKRHWTYSRAWLYDWITQGENRTYPIESIANGFDQKRAH